MSICLAKYFWADIQRNKIWRLIWQSAAAWGCYVPVQYRKLYWNIYPP